MMMLRCTNSGGETRGRGHARAYSLLELLITVLIIQIISSMVVVNVSGVQAQERLQRAANQVITALRYARMLSMSSGQSCGVEFNQATNTIRVFQGASQTTVSDSTMPGGTYVIDLTNQRDISGVKIASCNFFTITTSNPYQLTFATLGHCTNGGTYATVVLSYGPSHAITVKVPVVGEATVVP